MLLPLHHIDNCHKVLVFLQGRWRESTSLTLQVKKKVRWRCRNGRSTLWAQTVQRFSMSLVWSWLEQGVYSQQSDISFELRSFSYWFPLQQIGTTVLTFPLCCWIKASGVPSMKFCPCAGSGVERIDLLCFLARCKRRLNQALSVLSLSLVFFWVCLLRC